MHGLDLFTMAVVSVANFLLAAGLLLAVRLLNQSCHGLRRCMFACLMLAGGFAALAVNLDSLGRVRLILVNGLFAIGAVLYLDGIRAFRELKRPARIYGTVLTIFFLALVWFLFVQDNAGARVAIRAFFLATIVLSAVAAMAVDVPSRERGVYWSTAAVSALFCISLTARGLVALTGTPVDVLRPGPVDFFTIVTMNIWVLGGAFGLTMATNLRLQHQTEQLALFDALTGLPNRRLFEERLEDAERRALANHQRMALIFCDLDHFKHINDTLGHQGGDSALRIVAARMREVAGDAACLARVGGDEFIVLLENAPSRDELDCLIQRLRDRVGGSIGTGGRKVALQISCGVAVFPDDVGNAADLIRLADAAMYVMKQHGRIFAGDPRPDPAELPSENRAGVFACSRTPVSGGLPLKS